MQIIYTQAELSEIVQKYVQETLNLSDDNSFVVDTHEEGVTIHINEEPEGNGATPTGEKPVKKPRRTKAQIEADNKAEAERLAQVGRDAEAGKSNEPATVTTTAASAPVEEPATPEVAGETTPETSVSPGTTQVEAQAEEPETPSTVATTVEDVQAAAEEPATQAEAEPVKEAEAEQAAATETPKPTQSLFANLRRPKN